MHKRLHTILWLCLLLIIIVVIGVLHAGYNYTFETNDIFITSVERETKDLKVTVDCFSSAKAIKSFKYTKEDDRLIIRLYGGWIYPWDKGITDFTIEIDSNSYDQVLIKGKKTEKTIFSE